MLQKSLSPNKTLKKTILIEKFISFGWELVLPQNFADWNLSWWELVPDDGNLSYTPKNLYPKSAKNET